MKSDNRAISAILATLLFLTIIPATAILLYSLVNAEIDTFIESSFAEPFKLNIGNVAFNQSCITIHILNTGERDATLDNVYINKESRAFLPNDNDLVIKAGSNKEIYIFGQYIDGARFEIKIIFESGYAPSTMERY